MRHLLRGLGEHQAAAGIGAIEAAAGEIVEQRFVVELRIVAAQRELESVLAFRRAVAGARRAAHLIQDRRDIAEKRNLVWNSGTQQAPPSDNGAIRSFISYFPR